MVWQMLRACQGGPAVCALLQGCQPLLPQRALPVLQPQPWRRTQETGPATQTHTKRAVMQQWGRGTDAGKSGTGMLRACCLCVTCARPSQPHLLYAVNQLLALLGKVCVLLVAGELLDLCQSIGDQLRSRLRMRHAAGWPGLLPAAVLDCC